MQTIATTPFGRRPLTLAMVAAQAVARQAPPETAVHKWHVFRDVTEAREALGVGDRTLAVLNALLSFHPETALTAGEGLVVFPSNDALSLRTHGMAGTTLRRHLAVLVEVGLIARRDSPNGKRYIRKAAAGGGDIAYGFDLGPLVARAAEFSRLAEEARAERRAWLAARERVTLYRRDIGKMIALGLDEGISGDWRGFHVAFLDLSRPIARSISRAELEGLADELASLADAVRNALENHVNYQNTDGNDRQNERHYHNSNPNPLDFEPRFPESRGAGGLTGGTPVAEAVGVGDLDERDVDRRKADATGRPAGEPEASEGETARGMFEQPDAVSARRTSERTARPFPLGFVLKACPDIADYARSGISSWRELVATAALVRAALGISPDAWTEACEAMGEDDAAVTVAAILQRAEAITSAGGYLRSLSDKARTGQFSTGPMLMALYRAQVGRGGDKRHA